MGLKCLPRLPLSPPPQSITWMFVLYLPTLSSTPSLLPRRELHASPPTLPAREGTTAPAEECMGPRSSPVASKSRRNLHGAACSPGQGDGPASPCVPSSPSLPLHSPGDQACRGLSSGVLTPLLLVILNHRSLFPPSLQRPGWRCEDGRAV